MGWAELMILSQGRENRNETHNKDDRIRRVYGWTQEDI